MGTVSIENQEILRTQETQQGYATMAEALERHGKIIDRYVIEIGCI